MIKSGGENVYSAEVENAIISDNDAIKECAVVGLQEKQLGEMVVAAVVLRPGFTLSEEDIIIHCKKSIASYKKPRKVFFLDALPRNEVGKIQKFILREILERTLEKELLNK
jgi:fatty-acyl-CoA synthase